MVLSKARAFTILFMLLSVGIGFGIAETRGDLTVISDAVRSVQLGMRSDADVAREDAYKMLRSVYFKVRSTSTPAQSFCEAPSELTFAVDDAAQDAKRLIDWEAAYSNQEFVDRAMAAIREMESAWLELRLWKCE